MADDAASQQFLILAKNSKGKAASMVVQQALGAPGLYHFGELLAHPNIAPLQQQDVPTFTQLQIFAHGTYADYKAANLPALSPQQLTKLRQLTLVSLSNENKSIPYATLLQQLDLTNVRELEDLIIDSIYSGLVRGRLDQKDKCFLVDFATSRDIRSGQIDGLIRALTAWCAESDRLLRAIEEQMSVSASSHEAYRQHRKEVEERVEAMKKTVAAQEAEGGAHGMVMDPFDDDPRGRKGGMGKRGGAGRKGGGKRGGMFGMDWMNN